MLSKMLDWARYHLANGRDTICEFFADAFPFLLLFSVVGVAGSLTGLTTFTFLDDDPAKITAAISDEVCQISDRHTLALSELVTTSVDSLKQEISSLKTAIETDTSGGRRHRASPGDPPLCIKLPSGFDTDLDTLTAAAKGGNVLATGETYAKALVRHGFQIAEVAKLDEPTCQRVYDGWRTLYPPEARPVMSSPRGRWTCTGGRCYRN